MNNLSLAWTWLWAHGPHIALVVMTLTAFWQRQPESWRLKVEQDYPRLVGFVRLCIAVWPAVRDAYLAVRYQIIAGVPKEEVLAAKEAENKLPSPPKVPLVVLLATAAMLSGCPTYQRPTCPQVGAKDCRNDQPAYCDVGGWTLAGDTTCARVGGVCVVRNGNAFCATRAESAQPTP